LSKPTAGIVDVSDLAGSRRRLLLSESRAEVNRRRWEEIQKASGHIDHRRDEEPIKNTREGDDRKQAEDGATKTAIQDDVAKKTEGLSPQSEQTKVVTASKGGADEKIEEDETKKRKAQKEVQRLQDVGGTVVAAPTVHRGHDKCGVGPGSSYPVPELKRHIPGPLMRKPSPNRGSRPDILPVTSFDGEMTTWVAKHKSRGGAADTSSFSPLPRRGCGFWTAEAGRRRMEKSTEDHGQADSHAQEKVERQRGEKADRKAKQEADCRAQKAKADAERKKKEEEATRKAQEEAKQKEEADRKAKEADQKAKADAERKKKEEEATRKAQEEAKQKEEADRKAKEADQKAKADAERKKKEEEEAKKKQHGDPKDKKTNKDKKDKKDKKGDKDDKPDAGAAGGAGGEKSNLGKRDIRINVGGVSMRV